MKAQVNIRAPSELLHKFKKLGRERGWGGQQKALEEALKLYVAVKEGDVVAVIDGEIAVAEDIKQKLFAGEEFTAKPLPGTLFSRSALLKLGDIVADFLRENPPSSLSAGEDAIEVEDIPAKIEEGKVIYASWGDRRHGPFVRYDRLLVLSPSELSVEH